jgi:hypothetical protein
MTDMAQDCSLITFFCGNSSGFYFKGKFQKDAREMWEDLTFQ